MESRKLENSKSFVIALERRFHPLRVPSHPLTDSVLSFSAVAARAIDATSCLETGYLFSKTHGVANPLRG
jgi:hypothetical protein